MVSSQELVTECCTSVFMLWPLPIGTANSILSVTEAHL